MGKKPFNWMPDDGELRWCGMCAKIERWSADGGWKPYTPEPHETFTVPIQKNERDRG